MRFRILLLGTLSLSLFAAHTARAHAGYGIAVDLEGRVVFLDSLRSCVWRIERDGRLVLLARRIHANPLIQDPTGNFYAEDFNETLWKISSDDRKHKISVPVREEMSRARVGSLDELIAVDSAGNFYFRSGNDFQPRAPQLLRLTPQGEWSVLAGSMKGHADGQGRAARFQQMHSAAWGPPGILYVADENSIRSVALDGTVTTVAGGETAGFVEGPAAAARFSRILSVAVGANGDLFVADSDNFRVRRISIEGEVSTLLRTTPPWKPIGVSAAGEAVYVLERQFTLVPVWEQIRSTTHRVHRITLDGRMETLASVRGGIPRFALVLIGGVLGIVAAGAGMVFWFFQKRKRAP